MNYYSWRKKGLPDGYSTLRIIFQQTLLAALSKKTELANMYNRHFRFAENLTFLICVETSKKYLDFHKSKIFYDVC